MDEEAFWQAVDALVDVVLSTRAWRDFSRAVRGVGKGVSASSPFHLQRPVDDLIRAIEEELREVFADDPFRVRAEGGEACTACPAPRVESRAGDSPLEFFVARNIQ